MISQDILLKVAYGGRPTSLEYFNFGSIRREWFHQAEKPNHFTDILVQKLSDFARGELALISSKKIQQATTISFASQHIFTSYGKK